jgi:HEAT repeat protein
MGGNRGQGFTHSAAGEMINSDLQSLITDLTSGDDQIAESSVAQIAALGESALPALFGLLESKDSEQRWWALRTLAVIPYPEVPPRLRKALHDPDPAARQCAALGLSQQPSETAIPELIAALSDHDRLLARLAADALIVIGSAALPALTQTLENGTQSAQIEAARALALISDKSAIPALYKAWQEGSTLIQHWAEDGLDRMGVGMRFFAPEE